MPALRWCLAVLALLTAGMAHRQSRTAVDVGDRLRVRVAREYRADRIVVGARRIDTLDEVVRQDAATITVLGPTGRAARYPGRRARLVGRLTALDADWLTLDLEDGGPEVKVPRTAIQRLESSLGEPDRARSAAMGALLPGLPLGVVAFYLTGISRNFLCEYDCHPRYEYYIGAAVGVAIGAALRVAVEGERWDEVSLSLALQPRPGRGVSGGLSLRF